MKHKMKLNDEPFLLIKKGIKTVELRLNDEKRSKLNIGDTIVFTNNTTLETLEVVITGLKQFSNFKELYACYDKISMGYHEKEEAKPSDMDLYYPKAKQDKYGVLAIEITKYNQREANHKLRKLIKKYYSISVTNFYKITTGTSTLFNLDNQYVLKIYPTYYKEKDLQKEIKITQFLNNRGLHTTEFIKTNDNNYYFIYQGRLAVLENFIVGRTYCSYSLDKEKMLEASALLGQIVKTLEDFSESPVYNWQKKLTISSLKQAIVKHQNLIKETTDLEIINDLNIKIDLLNKAINTKIFQDIDDLTIKLSHGDYGILQFIYEDNHIKAVIDFIGAGYLPINWEIIRSYSGMDKACQSAKIDIDNLKEYIKVFMQYVPLTTKDLKYMPHIYLAKLLQSTFGYKEYLQSGDEELLNFGKWRTEMSKYLFENLNYLSNELENMH